MADIGSLSGVLLPLDPGVDTEAVRRSWVYGYGVLAPAPSGGDDLAALQAAMPTVGRLILRVGTYKISGKLTVSTSQDLVGQGGNLAGSQTTIQCTASSSQVEITNVGSVSGNFCIDGNAVATLPLWRSIGTTGAQRTFINLSVIGSAQDNILITGCQNDTWLGCNAQYPVRDNLVLDQGAGGNAFYRCEYNGAPRYQLRISDNVASGPYTTPIDNTFHHCIFERESPGGVGVSSVYIDCSADHLVFDSCSFWATHVATGPRIDITEISSVWIKGGRIQGDSGTVGGIGIRVVDGTHLSLSDHPRFEGLTAGIHIASGNPTIVCNGDPYWAIVGTRVTNAVGAYTGDTSVKHQMHHPVEIYRQNDVDRAIALYKEGDAGVRFLLTGDGTVGFNDGVGYTPKATLFSDTAGVLGMPATQVVRTGRGATGSRPSASTVGSGSMFYDTTLGQPVWSNGSAWGTAGAATDPTLPLIYDSFVGKANGSLTTTDSGQTWISTGGILPKINGGKVGFPSGQTFPPSGATYAQVDAAVGCVKIGGTLRFDSSIDTGASVALGFFTTNGVVTTGTPTASPAHLAITPTYMQMSVFSNINTDFTSIIPTGFSSSLLYFPSPLGTDGTTTYPVEILLDKAASKAYVTVGDNPTVEYQDWRIGATLGRFPFWESFGAGAATNLGGFTTVYADTDTTPTELNAARGASRSRNGAGTSAARFTSTLRPGSLWWDTTTSKSTISSGSAWRDVATGAVVGNTLTPNLATASESAVMAGSGTRVRANGLVLPWKNSTAYRVTSTLAGVAVCYVNQLLPVTAGQTYSFIIDQVLALTTARTAYTQINWYTAASAPVGTNPTGTPTSISTTVPTTLPAATGVAPATATQVFIVVNINATAVNDAFLLTRFGFYNGTQTVYLEP